MDEVIINFYNQADYDVEILPSLEMVYLYDSLVLFRIEISCLWLTKESLPYIVFNTTAKKYSSPYTDVFILTICNK